MSTHLADIVNRWRTNHPVPAVLGAAAEGTAPPFVVFVFEAGGVRRLSPGVVAWRVGSISFRASAANSVDSEAMGNFAIDIFDNKSFGAVSDMVYVTRLLYYTDKPTLTGNRGWITQVEFTFKY